MSFEDLLAKVDDNNQKLDTAAREVQQESAGTAIINPETEKKYAVDLSKFNDQDVQTVRQLKENINFTNSSDITSLGSEVQSSIAKFADGILQGVKTKDTGVVGQNLTTLLTTIQGVDMDKLQEKKSFFDKIPFLKSFSNNVSAMKIKVENVTETVDKIVVALDTARKELIRDINVLDSLYDKNFEYLKNLELCIAAGEMKHNELSETILVELKQKAEATQDMLDIQKYNDFCRMLTELEKRIYDLRLSREIAIQTMPQIRIIQSNDKTLANKIQASILTTIPIWKNQMALAISLNRQKTALELQKKVSDTTEDMLKQNAELLKMNSIEVAKESERGIISIETLRETHTKLLETIEESVKIYQEGRQKRQNVEEELHQLEESQKQKLLAIREK